MTCRFVVLSLLLAACESAEGRTAMDCRDGADNDGDGLFDCDDMGCVGSPDCDGVFDAGMANDAGSDPPDAENDAGGNDAGMACLDACTTLFACGLEGGPPMELQWCPLFAPEDETAFVEGCISTCESNPSIATLVNPDDCLGTINTLTAVSPAFSDQCHPPVCCADAYVDGYQLWLRYMLQPCGCAAASVCIGDCGPDPACTGDPAIYLVCSECLDASLGDACAASANDMCAADSLCEPYLTCRQAQAPGAC